MYPVTKPDRPPDVSARHEHMTIQLHIIILGIMTLFLTTTVVFASRRFRRSWQQREGTKHPRFTYINWEKEDLPSYWARGVGICLAVVIFAAFVVSLAPFQPRYWVLSEQSGVIASISNRFNDGSGDLSGDTYTVTLEGDSTPRVVTDSRILGLHSGDQVDMTCSLEWVYGGADRSNCYLRSF